MGIEKLLGDFERTGYKFAEVVFLDFKEEQYSIQNKVINSRADSSNEHVLSLSRIIDGTPITLTPRTAGINLYPPTEQGRCFRNYHFKLDLEKKSARLCSSKTYNGHLDMKFSEHFDELDKEAELICQIFMRNGWKVENLSVPYSEELANRLYPPEWAKPAED